MVALARNALKFSWKVLFFFGLFWLSVPYIHTYPIPLPPEHQHILFMLSRRLGINDPRDFYVSAVIVVNLLAAVIEYKLLMWLWGKIKRKWNTRRRHHSAA